MPGELACKREVLPLSENQFTFSFSEKANLWPLRLKAGCWWQPQATAACGPQVPSKAWAARWTKLTISLEKWVNSAMNRRFRQRNTPYVLPESSIFFGWLDIYKWTQSKSFIDETLSENLMSSSLVVASIATGCGLNIYSRYIF